jgi:hypothetical protein
MNEFFRGTDFELTEIEENVGFSQPSNQLAKNSLTMQIVYDKSY